MCEHYGADCQTLAISGKGLFANCCDTNETMAELYQRTSPSDPATLYNNSLFVPDAAVLALGTNDQNHNSGPAWVAGFTAAYAQFLVNLTQVHGNPRLPIFCLVGPITHDYYSWVVEAIALSGVPSAVVVNMTTPVDKCGHPSWASHQMVRAARAVCARARVGSLLRTGPAPPLPCFCPARAHCHPHLHQTPCPNFAHARAAPRHAQMFEQLQPYVSAALGW